MRGDLVDRLRGRYPIGPHLPNGNPEFGWRQFESTPINEEAAEEIERLRGIIQNTKRVLMFDPRMDCIEKALIMLDEELDSSKKAP